MAQICTKSFVGWGFAPDPLGSLERSPDTIVAFREPTSKGRKVEEGKIGGRLLLITNRKSHMSYRLVPKSVTLNDLERRNSPNRSVYLPNSVAFGADYVKVI